MLYSYIVNVDVVNVYMKLLYSDVFTYETNNGDIQRQGWVIPIKMSACDFVLNSDTRPQGPQVIYNLGI